MLVKLRADTVNASLKFSQLWLYVHILPPLKRNTGLNTASQEFSHTLLQLGDGTFANDNGRIKIDAIGTPVSSIESLIEHVWPDVANLHRKSPKWVAERALLAPLNSTVNRLNKIMGQGVLTEVGIYNFIYPA